jgi:hypothetical protein
MPTSRPKPMPRNLIKGQKPYEKGGKVKKSCKA